MFRVPPVFTVKVARPPGVWSACGVPTPALPVTLMVLPASTVTFPTEVSPPARERFPPILIWPPSRTSTEPVPSPPINAVPLAFQVASSIVTVPTPCAYWPTSASAVLITVDRPAIPLAMKLPTAWTPMFRLPAKSFNVEPALNVIVPPLQTIMPRQKPSPEVLTVPSKATLLVPSSMMVPTEIGPVNSFEPTPFSKATSADPGTTPPTQFLVSLQLFGWPCALKIWSSSSNPTLLRSQGRDLPLLNYLHGGISRPTVLAPEVTVSHA